MNQKLLALRNALLGTHDGRFNSDEVGVTAVLLETGIIDRWKRTRDPLRLATCDIRADVGGLFNRDSLDYDHHGWEIFRANGVPLSAFGLIWNDGVGEMLCGSAEVADIVDQLFVQPIDARDCGAKGVQKSSLGKVNKNYSLSDEIHNANPGEHGEDVSPAEFDREFGIVVERMRYSIKVAIRRARRELGSIKYVCAALAARNDPRLLVLDKHSTWLPTVQNEGKDVKVVVLKPDGETGWRVARVGEKMPQDWWGQTGEGIVTLTGLQGVKFCADTGYQVATDEKDVALALADILLKL